MNTDVAFTIGKTHQVCQDYGSSGQIAGNPYIIIADGCSSAPFTDFGSRLLVQANHLHLYDPPVLEEIFGDKVPRHMLDSLNQAHVWSMEMALPEECMFATLLTAHRVGDAIQVSIAGDGVVVAKHKNGALIVRVYEFPKNAPSYLAYYLKEEWRQQYILHLGGPIHINTYTVAGDNLKCHLETTIDISPKTINFPLQDYDLIALMTDGVSSFYENVTTATSKTQKKLGVLDVIEELMDFKNYNGEFVQRRFTRAMQTFAQKGWFHGDDVCVAAVKL